MKQLDNRTFMFILIGIVVIALVFAYPYISSGGQFTRGGLTPSPTNASSPPGGSQPWSIGPRPSIPPQPTPNCTDTDGGAEPFIKGFITGIRAGTGEYGEEEDYCSTDYNLVEFYCRADNTFDAVSRTCYGGCVDGACIWTSDCPLTDVSSNYPRGDNPYMKGTWTYEHEGMNFTEEDECRDNSGWGDCSGTDGCEVYERFCEEGGINAQTAIPCSYGCSSGACLKGAEYSQGYATCDINGAWTYNTFGNIHQVECMPSSVKAQCSEGILVSGGCNCGVGSGSTLVSSSVEGAIGWITTQDPSFIWNCFCSNPSLKQIYVVCTR